MSEYLLAIVEAALWGDVNRPARPQGGLGWETVKHQHFIRNRGRRLSNISILSETGG